MTSIQLPPSRRGKTILVVDDEPEIVNVLAELLTQERHDVDTALNGVLALEKLREKQYDLILSDLSMPLLDGPGFYRELEQHHPQLLDRVIFMTGALMKPETQEFLRRTGVLCLCKPLELTEVWRAVRGVLERQAFR